MKHLWWPRFATKSPSRPRDSIFCFLFSSMRSWRWNNGIYYYIVVIIILSYSCRFCDSCYVCFSHLRIWQGWRESCALGLWAMTWVWIDGGLIVFLVSKCHYWAEPSPLLAHRARPTPFNCKNEYLVLALGEETAVQVVVGCIVWVFRRLKTPSQDERPRLRAP